MPDMSDRDRGERDSNPKFAPLCIWCSAPWSDKNVQVYAVDCGGCPTCGPEIETAIRIFCHECKREMYRKEGMSNDYF